MTTRTPYSCDLNDSNDVVCEIDASTFFIDGGTPYRKWFSPGDFLKVSFPTAPRTQPLLSIVDGEDPSQVLEFRQTPTIRFNCDCLSEFTQYFTFSAAYGGTNWQVEIVRQRQPQENPSDPDENLCQVNFFFNVISTRNIQDTAGSGSGGGYQRF